MNFIELLFRIQLDNLEELIPIVYTPTGIELNFKSYLIGGIF